METGNKIFEVRCRGIIIDNNEILLVSHVGKEAWYALPGGHLEWGESIIDCCQREIVEELGITPVIGPVLYIHTFTNDDRYITEFFFQINNASDFRQTKQSNPSHAHELAAVSWVPLGQSVPVRPAIIADAIRENEFATTVVIVCHVPPPSVVYRE